MCINPPAQPTARKIDSFTQNQLLALISALITTKNRDLQLLRSYARMRWCHLNAVALGEHKQADAFRIMAKRAFARLPANLRW